MLFETEKYLWKALKSKNFPIWLSGLLEKVFPNDERNVRNWIYYQLSWYIKIDTGIKKDLLYDKQKGMSFNFWKIDLLSERNDALDNIIEAFSDKQIVDLFENDSDSHNVWQTNLQLVKNKCKWFKQRFGMDNIYISTIDNDESNEKRAAIVNGEINEMIAAVSKIVEIFSGKQIKILRGKIEQIKSRQIDSIDRLIKKPVKPDSDLKSEELRSSSGMEIVSVIPSLITKLFSYKK